MENENEKETGPAEEETEPIELSGFRVRAVIEGENFYFFVSPTLVSGTVPRENDPAMGQTRRVVDEVCRVVSEGLRLLQQREVGVCKKPTDQ